MSAYHHPTGCMARGCMNLLPPPAPGQPGRVRSFCSQRCYQRHWKKEGAVLRRTRARRHRQADVLPRVEGQPTRCQRPSCHNLLWPGPRANGRHQRFCGPDCYNAAWRLGLRPTRGAHDEGLPSRHAPTAGSAGPPELPQGVPLDGVPLQLRYRQRLLRAVAVARREKLEVELALERFGLTPGEWENALRLERKARAPRSPG